MRLPPTPAMLRQNTFKPCWKAPLILLSKMRKRELVFKFINALQLWRTHIRLSHKIREQEHVWSTQTLVQYSSSQRIKKKDSFFGPKYCVSLVLSIRIQSARDFFLIFELQLNFQDNKKSLTSGCLVNLSKTAKPALLLFKERKL